MMDFYKTVMTILLGWIIASAVVSLIGMIFVAVWMVTTILSMAS